jgi:DNA-binding MarR family transcriptional regulator
MHQIFFLMKRSHWGIQNKLRSPLKDDFDITAARVDMLNAIHKSRYNQWLKEQRRLSERLGVTRSVVSRMLRAMELRGWIRREKAEYDRRMWLVSITETGQELLDRVMRKFVRSGRVAHWVYRGLMGKLWWRWGVRFDRLLFFEDDLDFFRRNFKGGGTLYYPFGHPDD